LKLFGTSGVRGRISEKVTPELASRLSLSFANFLGCSGSVAVGMDTRIQSKVLYHSCLSGLVMGGLNVIDLGVIPTPVLPHIIKFLKLNGGVMLTASHTPPQYCGMLFFGDYGGELTPNECLKLEKLFFSNSLRTVNWNELGYIEHFDNAVEIYVQSILASFNVKQIRSKGFKVILDLCNSPYGPFFSELAARLGVHIFTLNDMPSGFFPGRGANLKIESLKYLSPLMVNLDFDVGLALDGDGDRCFFIDSEGNILSGDVAGSIFAGVELYNHGPGLIICPINTSKLILDVASKFNGSVKFTRVGPPAIIEALRIFQKALFAFEESGKYIWPTNILYGDPGFALCKMLQLLCKYNSIWNVLSDFPRYFQVKLSVPCPDKIKVKVLSSIIHAASTFNPVKIVVVDGLKIHLADESWILFRPSGTEPVFRIFVESTNKEVAEQLASKALTLVETIISSLTE